MQGLLASGEAEVLQDDEREKLDAVRVALWNVKARAKAVRTGKALGWEPRERPLMDEVPNIVISEAQRSSASESVTGEKIKTSA